MIKINCPFCNENIHRVSSISARLHRACNECLADLLEDQPAIQALIDQHRPDRQPPDQPQSIYRRQTEDLLTDQKPTTTGSDRAD